jgi:serine/threonine protein phosphatase PrpC
MGLMRKLFRKSTVPDEQPATAEPADRSEDQLVANSNRPPVQLRRLRFGQASDVGRLRSHNEDVSLAFSAANSGDAPLEPFGVFILADGMGGHQSGEIASSLAARIIANQILQDIYSPYLLNGNHESDQIPLAETLRTAIEAANMAVHDQVPGSGTTLTCALVLNTRAYLAHVGDSRAYLFHNQQLKQITRDHSYVDKLVELGQLSAEAAAVHPQRNVLYRAVGQGEQLETDIHVVDLPPGSKLLLCCDGLWGMLSDSIIQSVLASVGTPQEACNQLVAAANEAGGKDNITAIIVDWIEQ